jgi:hypothetical protein
MFKKYKSKKNFYNNIYIQVMESSDAMNNQRNRPNRDGSVDEEVQRLLRKSNGMISSNDFMKLRQKYDDVNLVEKIQRAYLEKHHHISKKAKKFAQLIREKYSNQQYPFHVLLEKARLYKQKYNLSEDEFTEFQRIYEQELVGISSNEVMLPMTNMMKMLGSVSVDYQGFNNKLNDNDYKYLQELLKLFASSRPLHAQVVLQSLQYQDCSFEAISGQFKPDFGHKPGDSVHPVIAALFFPKIPLLEKHFLQSNIAGIVKARYSGENLTNQPDYELFYSLTNDPNDVVCDNRSTVLDLLNRAQVQQHLWNSVLNLRNGQYYNVSSRDFVGAVDMCRLNKNDNPDLIYGRYDGTILKRLLSTFSFRPTIVAAAPVYNPSVLNPYQQNVRPVVTAIPMFNVRLPSNQQGEFDLSSIINIQQPFLENGAIITRTTEMIYSRGVLFFFVDRRSNIMRFEQAPMFNLNRLPLAISGFERINNASVSWTPEITCRNQTYKLRSVVTSETNTLNTNDNYVIGSAAIIRKFDNPQDQLNPSCFAYSPMRLLTDDAGNRGPTVGISEDNFVEIAKGRGTIFMYQSNEDINTYQIGW